MVCFNIWHLSQKKKTSAFLILSEHITCTYKISNCFTLSNESYFRSFNTNNPTTNDHTENILTKLYMYTHLYVHTLANILEYPFPNKQKSRSRPMSRWVGSYPCQSIPTPVCNTLRYSSHSWCSVHLHVLERTHSKQRSPNIIQHPYSSNYLLK